MLILKASAYQYNDYAFMFVIMLSITMLSLIQYVAEIIAQVMYLCPSLRLTEVKWIHCPKKRLEIKLLCKTTAHFIFLFIIENGKHVYVYIFLSS